MKNSLPCDSWQLDVVVDGGVTEVVTVDKSVKMTYEAVVVIVAVVVISFVAVVFDDPDISFCVDDLFI